MIHSFPRLMASALFALAATASAVSLSGRVVAPGTTPVGVPGVTVSLAGASLTTQTDAQGAWSLGIVGVTPRASEPARLVSGHLLVDQGRLRVSLQGRDLLGRGAVGMEARSVVSAAARALAGPDTLVYSMGGKVFLRDTLTGADQTEIVRVFDTTWNPDVVYGYLKDDRDGQVYRTVKIRYRVWMAQNLNFDVDGSLCAAGKGKGNGGCEEFGRLYSWSAALGLASVYDTSEAGSLPRPHRGICPAGWHVPDTLEWLGLVRAVGEETSAGAVLRARFSWSMLRADNPDLTGFRALETSRAGSDGSARFWALEESGAKEGWARAIYPDWSSGGGGYRLHRSVFSKSGGISLRCVLDP